MMWNYRLVYCSIPSEEPVSIREIYYDDDDEIETWSAEPESVYGDTREETIQCYLEMAEAFVKLPLELVEIDGEKKLVPYRGV